MAQRWAAPDRQKFDQPEHVLSANATASVNLDLGEVRPKNIDPVPPFFENEFQNLAKNRQEPVRSRPSEEIFDQDLEAPLRYQNL